MGESDSNAANAVGNATMQQETQSMVLRTEDDFARRRTTPRMNVFIGRSTDG